MKQTDKKIMKIKIVLKNLLEVQLKDYQLKDNQESFRKEQLEIC